MKKILFLPLLIVALFAGCDGVTDDIIESDGGVEARYIYENQTSWELTVKSYSVSVDGKLQRDSIFVLPRNGKHELYFGTGFVPPAPLWWLRMSSRDSTIVSNGEKQIIYREWENGKLYFKENYALIEEGKKYAKFQYTFTDADFENAEPVNP